MDKVNDLFDRALSRKFIIIVVLNLFAAYALLEGKISGDNWAMVASASITAYTLANVWEKRK